MPLQPTHEVAGIVQMRVNGEWCERPYSGTVYAATQRDAAQQVLDFYAAMAREQDAYATVRWYDPPWIRGRGYGE